MTNERETVTTETEKPAETTTETVTTEKPAPAQPGQPSVVIVPPPVIEVGTVKP